MRITSRSSRLLALSAAFAVVAGAFFVVVRPWYRQWGATAEEMARPLPGDEIIPAAAGQETRAITIEAGAERVWPWLAQLGQDRGGFYSYDLLENVVGCDMPTVDVLRPDRQLWRVGDRLWMYPKHKAGGMGFATLQSYIPGRALGFATRAPGTSLQQPPDGSWSFVLEPIDDASTRLLIRGRGAPGRSMLGAAFDRSIFEPMHFVMERRTMIGLKQLAETGDRHRLLNHVHVALWTITFVALIIAAVEVMRRPRWLRPLGAFVAAAVVFQVLSLGQPPLLIAIALVLGLLALLGGRASPAAAGARADASGHPRPAPA